jgi:hypothetical protein
MSINLTTKIIASYAALSKGHVTFTPSTILSPPSPPAVHALELDAHGKPGSKALLALKAVLMMKNRKKCTILCDRMSPPSLLAMSYMCLFWQEI